LTINGADKSALIRTSNGIGTAKLKFEADGTNYAGIGLENTALVFRCSNNSSPTERMRIDSSGRVMIGTTSTSGISGSADDIIIGSIGDSTSRGITFATTTDGTIRWADAGDNAMGRIQYLNNTDVMTFHTSNASRLRLDSDGMKFGSDTAAANALDDYEEGTFTPSYTVGSGGGNMVNNATYNQIGGVYTKVGRLVLFSLRIQLNSGFTVIGGHVVINGLPFTAGAAGTNGGQCGATFGYRAALGTNAVELYIPSGGTQIQFYDTLGVAYYAGAGGNNFANTLHIWGSYHAA
jgi:hypothetical protein